jgi:DNA-binding NtrC family response regulator
LGAFSYLEKPLEKDQLLLAIGNAVNQARLLKETMLLKDQLYERFHIENIVGAHGRMEELFRVVRRVAPTTSTVLIFGESGTGKELFAKGIHYNSPRKGRLFFAINCAAIPETLLESELFGYEKGAFTGALTRHIGLFEQANGSTLFLDEIGDLTLNTQAKLLRVIQERELRRIGGKENIKLDVRIIAATNKKLDEEIRKGRFREDLFYRLNVISFTIPPLRERITDVPILVEHFLRRLNEIHDQKVGITREALGMLMDYTWPGNVRQLESVVERAYIMCEGDMIGPDCMPEEAKQGDTARAALGQRRGSLDYLIDARLTAAEYRIYFYLLGLEESDGDVRELAEPKAIIERLGINKDTFYTAVAKLKDLGLYDFKTRTVQAKGLQVPRGPRKSPSEISD